MSLSVSIKPSGNRININNFQGVSDEQIYEAFSNVGSKKNVIVDYKIYKEHDGTSKYRGYIIYRDPKSCNLAKLYPPVFNGIPVAVSHPSNGSICEITDESDFSDLYIFGSIDDTEFIKNSINFDTQMIRKKIEDIQASKKLRNIEILNRPFSGTFGKQFAAILQYEDHESAKQALNKANKAKESAQINFKCTPAFTWG